MDGNISSKSMNIFPTSTTHFDAVDGNPDLSGDNSNSPTSINTKICFLFRDAVQHANRPTFI